MTSGEALAWTSEGPELVDMLALEQPGMGRLRRSLAVLAEGAWEPDALPERRRSPLGALIMSGFLVRDVEIAGLRATELLGEGDVIVPWSAEEPDDFLPTKTSWAAFTPARVLVIEPPLAELIRSRRLLHDAHCRAAGRRVSSLAAQRAIAQLPRVELRLLALMWHLAGRWGRVGPSGVVVPLRLSHAFLGRLVGARRPTVTLALRELSDRGYATRREDGTWQLQADAPGALDGSEPAPKRTRRTAPKDDPVDRLAGELLRHVKEARERARVQAETLPDHLTRLGALRRQSAEVREHSAAVREEVKRARAQRARQAELVGDD
jgi:DNA-binding transcriptional ArsR family regulator